jgi:trehalose-6-phosphatase
MDLTSTAAPLDVPRVLPRYRHSHKRLLLIDFEGTLWQRDISKTGLLHDPFAPPQEGFDVLNRLAEDRRNEVWLLSGLAVKGKMDMVAEKLPNVGIV